MSFIYSRALVAASLPGSCLDTDASAPSSGSPTPKPCLWHDKTMAPSRLSRFGMTCKPLTDDLGQELLTSWLAAFPAKTSAPLGGGQALTASAAACGTTWPGSLARYDRATSSWKTAQCSLLGDSEEFSATWPRWGLMRDGACWEQPTLVPRTSASGSGLWRTPSAHVIEAKSTVTKLTGRKPSDPQVGLADQVIARVMWQTPVANDSVNRVNGNWNSRGEPKLSAQVLWPTPTICGNYNQAGMSKKSGDGLATAVRIWPTATATAYKGWSPNHNRAATDDRLDYSVERESYQPGQPIPPMRLNPQWVEWLMGWPIGHTDLKPLETDKFQEWRQQHGSC